MRGEYRHLLEPLNALLARRRQDGLLGNNILGIAGADFEIEIHLGAGAYICGEESALIESLEGKRGTPRNRPPFPVTNGYLDQPTIVNNVETFAAAALIALNGGDWYA
jgi:[NiFe] hydrogenase diaphorase moiety large subunit